MLEAVCKAHETRLKTRLETSGPNPGRVCCSTAARTGASRRLGRRVEAVPEKGREKEAGGQRGGRGSPGEPGGGGRGEGQRGGMRGDRAEGQGAAALPVRGSIEVAFRKEEEETQVQKSEYENEGVGVAGKGVEGKKISPGRGGWRDWEVWRVGGCCRWASEGAMKAGRAAGGGR